MGHKKLTVAELVKNKELLSPKNMTRELYIERLGGTITIKKPEIELVMEIASMDEANLFQANKQLVYECVTEPNLKDTVLQSEYGCVEPWDIVYNVFDLGEVNSISTELMDMSGINSQVEVIATLKKQ